MGLFEMPRMLHFRAIWSLSWTWVALAAWIVLAWVVLFWRARRLEVNG